MSPHPQTSTDSRGVTEIIARIRRIEIKTRQLVQEAVAGQYHSVFRGQGMNYEDVRPYQAGDDIRSIDWNVTARTGDPHVKLFTEERELTVLVLLDVSPSGIFGSCPQSKRLLAAEVAAALAFSAVYNGDKIGAALFTDRTELIVPPRKGRLHALRLIRDMLYFQPIRRGTDIGAALSDINRLLTRRAVVFLISDFLSADFSRPFAATAQKHDLIAVRVSDPRETDLPDIGWVTLEDPETGDQLAVNTSDPKLRKRHREARIAERSAFERFTIRHRVDLIDLDTDSDFLPPLRAFFRTRTRRARVR